MAASVLQIFYVVSVVYSICFEAIANFGIKKMMTLDYFYRFFLDDSLSTSKFQGTIRKEGRLSYPSTHKWVESKELYSSPSYCFWGSWLCFHRAREFQSFKLGHSTVFNLQAVCCGDILKIKSISNFQIPTNFQLFVFLTIPTAVLWATDKQPPKEAQKRSFQKKIRKLFWKCSWFVFHIYPVDTGRKLSIHKTFIRRPGRLLNVLCTLNLRPVSTG